MTAFPVDGHVELRVQLQLGSLEVIAAERDDVVVIVEPTRPNRGGDVQAADRTRVAASAGVVSVSGPAARWNLFSHGDSVDVRIEAPVGADLTARVGYGAVRSSGALGDVRIEVSAGDVDLDRAASLQGSGGHGGVRAHAVEGDVTLTLASGSARIDRVGGAARIKGSHGDIAVGEVGSGGTMSTASGSIEVGTASGELAMRTAYGALRVGDAVRGAVRLETSYGAIDVAVRPGTAVWLDAASQHGVVRSLLTADDGPVDGDETLELRARTTHGDVIVHRSAHP